MAVPTRYDIYLANEAVVSNTWANRSGPEAQHRLVLIPKNYNTETHIQTLTSYRTLLNIQYGNITILELDLNPVDKSAWVVAISAVIMHVIGDPNNQDDGSNAWWFNIFTGSITNEDCDVIRHVLNAIGVTDVSIMVCDAKNMN